MDAHKLLYDEHNPFAICGATYKPIYRWVSIQDLHVFILISGALDNKHGLRKVYTVFLRSDATADIVFIVRFFLWLLFEGGICFIEKPAEINDSWMRYV